MRIFGIDEPTARDLVATVPRRVKRGVPRVQADNIANALRGLGAEVDVRATSSAHTSASRAKISLSNVAPLTPPSSGIELAFEPGKPARAAPRPTPTPPPEAVAPITKPTSTLSPLLLRVGIGLGFVVLSLGVRMAWRHARTPSEAELAATEEADTADSIAAGIPVETFLTRSHVSLGTDVDRNQRFATDLRGLGATRVLVTDVIQLNNTAVGTRLVVMLPPSPNARRAIAEAVARFYANGEPIERRDVELPDPSEAYVLVDLE